MSLHGTGKDIAIVAAGGSGSRMETDMPKQYLTLCGKPVICHCLEAFEKSEIIDEVIIVAAADHVDYCRKEIVEPFGFRKVTQVLCGGTERYDSVYEGLKAAADADYVYIHDAARPCLPQELIERLAGAVRIHGAAAAAVPVKDTIKTVDGEGFAADTPDRSCLRMIQTPQVFSYPLIRGAYEEMRKVPHADVTDDTMAAEQYGGAVVKLVMGSYRNLKITTAEDLIMMEALVSGNGGH